MCCFLWGGDVWKEVCVVLIIVMFFLQRDIAMSLLIS